MITMLSSTLDSSLLFLPLYLFHFPYPPFYFPAFLSLFSFIFMHFSLLCYPATFLVGCRALLCLLDWFRTLRSPLPALLACLQTFRSSTMIPASPSFFLLFPNALKASQTPPKNSLGLQLPHLPPNSRTLLRTSALSNFRTL